MKVNIVDETLPFTIATASDLDHLVPAVEAFGRYVADNDDRCVDNPPKMRPDHPRHLPDRFEPATHRSAQPALPAFARSWLRRCCTDASRIHQLHRGASRGKGGLMIIVKFKPESAGRERASGISRSMAVFQISWWRSTDSETAILWLPSSRGGKSLRR